MKSLVTGAAGFVGRHLVAHLEACGDEIVATLGHDLRIPNDRHAPLVRRSLDGERDRASHEVETLT
ncbi:MAG: NAD-dependent epimerase/dehydratase family protein, partial [Acidimicrobiales bacterium]